MTEEYTLGRIKKYTDKILNGEKVDSFRFVFPRNKEESVGWKYDFWDMQPVTKQGTKVGVPRIIDSKVSSNNTVGLAPRPYEWYECVPDEKVITFLNKYFVEMIDAAKDKIVQCFDIDYLKWYIGSTGKLLCAKTVVNGVEHIGAVCVLCFRTMQLYTKKYKVCETKYMCIHPKLREKGLCEAMITEICRIAHNNDAIVGMFFTERYISVPVCKVYRFDRPINYKKMLDMGFIVLENSKELDIAINEYKPLKSGSIGVPMGEKDVDTVMELLNKYQDKYNIYEIYTRESFVETFMNNPVVKSFVIKKDDTVVDFFSYVKTKHKLNRNKDKEEYLLVGQMFMYTSNTITPLMIFKSAIIEAANRDKCDMFTCTDTMENLDVLYDNVNKFIEKSYVWMNFYNWECPEISCQQLGYACLL